jgi:hypothetical protein
VVLTAPSGAGTTSLLRAGVAGWLRERPAAAAVRHVPVWFGSWWGDPLRDLIATIEVSVGSALPREGLDEAVQAAAGAADATLLILLDQFDEHVQMRARDPGPRFVDELARCITDADLRAHFLIAVHDDAYAGLDQLLGSQVANLYGQTIRLDHLARAAAREAITGALDHYNRAHADAAVEAEPALVEAVLDETGVGVGGEDRVDAPMLQLVMAEFWRREHAAGSRVLRLEALRAMGGAAHVIREHLPRALDALDPGERDVARDLLGFLVTPSGAKLALTVGDLADFTGHAEDRVANVLSRLEDTRIVMRVMPPSGRQSGAPPRYEIFHGALAPVILHWRARQPAELREPR